MSCEHKNYQTLDTRAGEGVIRKRRRCKCADCGETFTTVEVAIETKVGRGNTAETGFFDLCRQAVANKLQRTEWDDL